MKHLKTIIQLMYVLMRVCMFVQIKEVSLVYYQACCYNALKCLYNAIRQWNFFCCFNVFPPFLLCVGFFGCGVVIISLWALAQGSVYVCVRACVCVCIYTQSHLCLLYSSDGRTVRSAANHQAGLTYTASEICLFVCLTVWPLASA